MINGRWKPPIAVIEAVEQLMIVAIHRHYDAETGECLTECKMCGEWDKHADECLIPLLDWWQAFEGRDVAV